MKNINQRDYYMHWNRPLSLINFLRVIGSLLFIVSVTLSTILFTAPSTAGITTLAITFTAMSLTISATNICTIIIKIID